MTVLMENTLEPDKRVHTLLEQELDCFHQIMYRTQEVLDDSDSASLKTILDLLDIRDYWIDKIKVLESQMNQIGEFEDSGAVNQLRNRIQALAKSLVVTDAKLFDILQLKKLGVIKELGKLAENSNRTEKSMRRNQQPKLIDTRRA